MNNGDLLAILHTAKINPELLPNLLKIYKIGFIQGIISEKKADKKLLENKISEVI